MLRELETEQQEDLNDYGRPLALDEDVELAVKHGMYWLDENVYGWVEVINLDMLDLESGITCVLGQQYNANHNLNYMTNGYMMFMDEARPHDTHDEKSEWAKSNGFLPQEDSSSGYNRLTRVWKDKIRERLA